MAISLRHLKVLGRNKAELYLFVLPIPLVVCALGKAPRGDADAIAAVEALLVASVLALNSLRDWGRMRRIERVIALPWARFLFCCTRLEIGVIVTVNGTCNSGDGVETEGGSIEPPYGRRNQWRCLPISPNGGRDRQ